MNRYGDVEVWIRKQQGATRIARYSNGTIWRNQYIRIKTNSKVYKAIVRRSMNGTIWKNKYISVETKSRTNKAIVRWTMLYTTYTRPDTAKTKQLLKTTKIRDFQRITGKTLGQRAKWGYQKNMRNGKRNWLGIRQEKRMEPAYPKKERSAKSENGTRYIPAETQEGRNKRSDSSVGRETMKTNRRFV